MDNNTSQVLTECGRYCSGIYLYFILHPDVLSALCAIPDLRQRKTFLVEIWINFSVSKVFKLLITRLSAWVHSVYEALQCSRSIRSQEHFILKRVGTNGTSRRVSHFSPTAYPTPFAWLQYLLNKVCSINRFVHNIAYYNMI